MDLLDEGFIKNKIFFPVTLKKGFNANISLFKNKVMK